MIRGEGVDVSVGDHIRENCARHPTNLQAYNGVVLHTTPPQSRGEGWGVGG